MSVVIITINKPPNRSWNIPVLISIIIMTIPKVKLTRKIESMCV